MSRRIVFGRSTISASGVDAWTLLIQGRIDEPSEGKPAREAIIELLAPLVGADKKNPLYLERAGRLASDSIPNAFFPVEVAGQILQIGPSDSAGCFSASVRLTSDQISARSENGEIGFASSATPDDPVPFEGTAVLVQDEGLVVVTDMDDTIKVTDIKDRAEAKANTFVRPFVRFPAWRSCIAHGPNPRPQ